jgi:hypothetical protein
MTDNPNKTTPPPPKSALDMTNAEFRESLRKLDREGRAADHDRANKRFVESLSRKYPAKESR